MLKHKELTQTILQIYYEVYNELGYGFLEKVYQNAMYYALIQAGIKVEAQFKISVYYKGVVVGDYIADLLVEDLVIIELKAVSSIMQAHELQLINYLKATNIEVGLLLNFGLKPEFTRKLWVNEKKKHLK